MQENEFEKSIRKKMGELHLVPNEQVWSSVLAEVQKERRKKRFLFFIIPFAILLMGAGTYLFYVKDQPVTSTKEIPVARTTNSQQNNSKSGLRKPNDEDKNEIRTEENKATSTIVDPNEKKAIDHDSNSRTNVFKPLMAGVSTRPFQHSSLKILKGQINNDRDKEFLNSTSSRQTNASRPLEKEISHKSEETATVTYPLTQQTTPADTSAQEVVKQQVKTNVPDTIKNSQANALGPKKRNSQKGKSWKFGVAVLAGISNNYVNYPTLTGNAAANSSSGSPTTSTGLGTAAISNLNYPPGLSYTIGFFVLRKLKRRVGLSIGLNYHYASSASNVGELVSRSQAFYDPTTATTQRVTEYYNLGSSTKYTNKYYLFELPVDLQLQLNKAENKPVLFTVGFSPGYLFSSKALYANSNQNLYYVDDQQFRKPQLAMQTGLQFAIADRSKFGIMIGPQLQYNLINMAKPSTQISQHLFTASIKASFQFK